MATYHYKAGIVTMTVEEKGDKVVVKGICAITGEPYSVMVRKAGFDKWLKERKHIQEALWDVPKHDREFLISGISPKGWDENVF